MDPEVGALAVREREGPSGGMPVEAVAGGSSAVAAVVVSAAWWARRRSRG